MDQLHIWAVTVGDHTQDFATLDAATGYLQKAFDPKQENVIESRLVDPEEFVRLTEGGR